MMTGPGFQDFLIRGANDRFLTNRIDHIINANFGQFVDFTNENYAQREAAHEKGDFQPYSRWVETMQHGFRRAPVELIAYVVENDRPNTEILTANYIMANPFSSRAYGASTTFIDPEDPRDFKPSRISKYYLKGDGYITEWNDVLQALHVLDPGPLRVNSDFLTSADFG